MSLPAPERIRGRNSIEEISMKPANYLAACPALELATHPSRESARWLPVQVDAARALDLSHWRSRAAGGFTWNRGGLRKRRPN